MPQTTLEVAFADGTPARTAVRASLDKANYTSADRVAIEWESIWTQNWPWTPVPEDGEVTYKKSVCTLCSGGCGIEVRLVNGRPVKINGIEDYPTNKGSLCPMGISGLQYLYGPSRVTSPLKREGKRGGKKMA